MGWNHQLVTDDFGGLFPSLFLQGKLFGSSNPFDWMELISLQGKTNFFEKRVTWDLKKNTPGRGEDFPSPFRGDGNFCWLYYKS